MMKKGVNGLDVSAVQIKIKTPYHRVDFVLPTLVVGESFH